MTAVMFILAGAADAQPLERDTVIVVDTITAGSVLATKAKRWVANTFKSAETVIQMEDSVQLVGKGRLPNNEYSDITFTMSIECRRGRARVRIYDVRHENNGRQIYTGSTYTTALSLGPIFDAPRCYAPIAVGFASQAGAEKKALKTCATWLPEINRKVDWLVTDLGSALKVAEKDW